MRIGHGYDVHRLVTGRKLIVGGVEIQHEKGLLGHSDADVLLHAIADALLGAAGEKDIGHQFPDSSPEYKNISSLLLLERVGDMIRSDGFIIEYIDSTILAQAPKMSPHLESMKKNIAAALKTDAASINIKATTEEVANKLFANMSSRMAQNIRDDLEITTNVRMKDVEDAQQRIVDVIRKLEDQNEIIIIKGGKDDIIA